jgi:transcriptional regulator with XRE-family HTH domain
MSVAVGPVAGADVEAVLSPLAGAIGGDAAAARRYARAWRRLVRDLVGGSSAPDATVDVLDHLALTAPFAPGGPVAALVSAARGIIEDVPLEPLETDPETPPDPLAYQRFSRVVLLELSGAGTGLERLMAAWQLSITDVARLFGVARQAVQQWLDDGAPAARQPKLATILRIADLLDHNLLPERVPGVVRTPAAAYGDRSMLQAIAADDHDDVREAVARSFDWASTA